MESEIYIKDSFILNNYNNLAITSIRSSLRNSMMPMTKKISIKPLNNKLDKKKKENQKINKFNYSSKNTKPIPESIIENSRGNQKNSNLFRYSLFTKTFKQPKIINKSYVFTFLRKNPNSRKDEDIISVAKYLSENYKYFANLKNNDSQLKVEKLTKITKLEIFRPGENIINYGDIGRKFYIVLEGFVEVYKPIYESVFITINEFIQILNKVKKIENNEKKYLRIKKYNKERNIDINEYENIDPDMDFMKVKNEFYIEKLEKLGKYGEGFSFGEIALIKNCERNATIKSAGGENEKVFLLSIDKESYNQAIKEFQEKKLAKDIENYINNYPFLNKFNKEKILKIFNYMNNVPLEKDEYLFHQNDIDDNLYFLIKGNLSLTINIGFPWINDYIDYITNMNNNIIRYLFIKKPTKFSKLIEIIQTYKEKKIKSPMAFDKYNHWEKIEDKENENNLIGLKNEEEKLNNSNNIFKLHIKNIDYPILLGIEDSFEFKNKLYSIKCLSDKAEIKSVKLIDFMKIIYNFNDDELSYLLEVILQRKQMLKNQFIQSIKYLSKKIMNKLEFKYENLMNSEKNNKNEKIFQNDNKIENKVVSLIKMKGYKNSIQDILDTKINFFGNRNEKFKSFDSINERNILLSNHKNQVEEKIYSKKLKLSKYDKYKNNKSNLLILRRILKDKKSDKYLKKYNKE